MHHRTSIIATLALVLVAVLAGLTTTGCRVGLYVNEVDYARSYPEDLEQTTVADVHVLRRNLRLELTNTSTRDFGPSTLWLNKQFSLPIDGLAVGESRSIWLREFVDEYSNYFRAGGFLATRDPDMLAIAQLETAEPREIVGLVVVFDEPR